MTSLSTVPLTDAMYNPEPTAMPMAAVAQIVAAVVSPDMVTPLRRIVPAPRKPTPVTIWAATLDWSAVSNLKAKIIVNIAEPRHTNDRVRSPAGLSALRRSYPTAQPNTAAQAT